MLTKTPTVAIVELDTVWHVGTLTGPPTKKRYSLEANHLSVSWCPEDWTRIARLGGEPTWELCKPHAQFIDVLRLTARQRADIINWGITHGHVTFEQRWKAVVSHDENDSEPMYSVFATKAEAVENSEDDEEAPPKTVKHLVATSTMLKHLGAHRRDADMGWDFLPMVWAEAHGLDGAWWRETYDPDSYSAPRGCILRNRVNEWTKRKLRPREPAAVPTRFPKTPHRNLDELREAATA